MANLNNQIEKINEQIKQLQSLLIKIFSSKFAKEKSRTFGNLVKKRLATGIQLNIHMTAETGS